MALLVGGVILTLAIVWSLGLSLVILAAILDCMLAAHAQPATKLEPAPARTHVWLRPLHRKASRA